MQKFPFFIAAAICVLASCTGESGNLALMRAARHSSAFDMNQTAQLVTDGIISGDHAAWVNLKRNGQDVPLPERNYMVDHNHTSLQVENGSITVELEFHGIPLDADKVVVAGNNYGGNAATSEAIIEVSKDGGEWVEAGRKKGRTAPSIDLIIYRDEWIVPLSMEPDPAALRLTLTLPGGSGTVNELFFFKGGQLLEIMPNTQFQSVWKSAGSENEWVDVDLGATYTLEKSVFHWLNPAASGKVQVSRDGKSWKDVAIIGTEQEIDLGGARGRYVRAVLDSTDNGEPFELSEWEIIGRKKAVQQHKADNPRIGDRQDIIGGWKLARASATDPSGNEISSATFDDSGWMDAKVPGTVLSSYIAAGAVHHPHFEANQLYISDSYFRSDFWYRGVFEANPDSPRQFLNFDGVNYQARIYLNGQDVGCIGSAFDAQRFDVTGILQKGLNCIAVKIICPPHYGSAKLQTAFTPDNNGGILGADNPTMHASIGWDWIPTVRGRNIGIYDSVYLTYKADVTVDEPFVRCELPLPDTTSAKVFASARLCNHGDEPVSGVLEVKFGELTMNKEVSLEAGGSELVAMEPAVLENPRLWWPNGYGKQELYPVEFTFTADGASDKVAFLSGVRQMTYSLEPYEPVSGNVFDEKNTNQRLSLYVNGRRFIGFGGNWGFPEENLEYKAREYDIAVGNHAQMNFTMIRDWVGMTDNKAFYEACDKYGIMIWQDFWLANPWDGPNPANPERFNEVATRYVRRIRNHPSVALYVGRNEGYPPEIIENHLETMIPQEHPGMFYIPHSAADGVTGGGPYRALPVKEYFQLHGHDKFHSERGMPSVMNYENMVRAFGENGVEPVNTMAHPNQMYGLHDYTLGVIASAAQAADSFNQMIEKGFGEPADAREFSYLAQWINYDGYRAIFEARSEYRRGMILWMSHPAWPSMVWQTYDYFFEPIGSFFGCKKACEPLHIQMNSLKGTVEVVNYHAGAREGLNAEARILYMDGSEAWRNSTQLDLTEDSTATCFPLEVPEDISEVYFVKLSLTDASGKVLSDNFYWQGREEGNYRALRTLAKTKLHTSVKKLSATSYAVTLENRGETPALMIRLKVKDSATGDLALPVWYSDNYFFLMPGESKCVDVQLESLRGRAVFETEGMNI
ncbi:MAG: discoidin domain-containing protein [Bacteroidales bacterium]|nr:discoidin domain-containing protein [Bacteroidales bacterium]